MKRQDCYVNIKQIHVTILPCSFWNIFHGAVELLRGTRNGGDSSWSGLDYLLEVPCHIYPLIIQMHKTSSNSSL